MVVVTDPLCVEYQAPGHPESPERVSRTVRHLQKQIELAVVWASPVPVEDAVLLRAHTPAHLRALEGGRGDFDADTPRHPDVAAHARRSLGGGLAALDRVQRGDAAFSLMRPPGHHATRDRAMGFCYLSNAAILALEARARGLGRVAVFDFDVHHGNGTEDILNGVEGTAFFSIHQFPCYPGTGEKSSGNCHNYPVRPGSKADAWMGTVAEAWDDLIAWKPDLVIVSAGFDAFKDDPLAQQNLEEADFLNIGKMIHTLGRPVVSLLEGGYSRELPDLVLAYLVGLEDG